MAQSLKIQYQSDLHFEFGYNRNLFHKQKYRKACGDVLVIAGDLDYLDESGEYSRGYTREYLSWAGDNYGMVYIVPGNHEYWGESPYDLSNAFAPYRIQFASNVILGSNIVEEYRGLKFALSTLWYRVNFNIERFLKSNERRWVRCNGDSITVDIINRLNSTCIDFLKESRADIVVTHHAPTYRVMHPIFETDKSNEQFYNNLDELIAELAPQAWIFGHLHYSDMRESDIFLPTRLLTNPLGYAWEEKTGFKVNSILEVNQKGLS